MQNFSQSFNKYSKASRFQTEATRDWSQLRDVQAVKQELVLHKLSSHCHMCICKVQAQPVPAHHVCQLDTIPFLPHVNHAAMRQEKLTGGFRSQGRERKRDNKCVYLFTMGDNFNFSCKLLHHSNEMASNLPENIKIAFN